MKISLTPEAYKTLYNVCQEMKVTAGELVSRLVIDYANTPIEQRDSPTHVCAFCPLAYFSKANLEWHIKRKHSDEMVIKK